MLIVQCVRLNVQAWFIIRRLIIWYYHVTISAGVWLGVLYL